MEYLRIFVAFLDRRKSHHVSQENAFLNTFSLNPFYLERCYVVVDACPHPLPRCFSSTVAASDLCNILIVFT